MNAITRTASVAILVTLGLAAGAAEPPKTEHTLTDLDKLIGQPVDVAPWGYAWRADRQVQEKPEASFVHRRLERIEKVFRPMTETPKGKKDGLTLLPAPKGRLASAVLWLSQVRPQRVELQWPEGKGAIPRAESVEVRVYPTGQWYMDAGWFPAFVQDLTLGPPEISEDRRTWVYRYLSTKDPKTGKPEQNYAADMVAVFVEDASRTAAEPGACPSIRMIAPQVWKRMDVEIEWGFRPGTEKAEFDGDLESWTGVVGKVAPLPEDKGTTPAGERGWRSRYEADSGRRGVALSLAYVPRLKKDTYLLLDTRITLRTKNGSFTFLPSELDSTGAIIVPELGFVVMRAGSGKTGRQRMEEWTAKNAKCLPQMVREHAEIGSWEQLMRRVRFDPSLTNLPPFQPFQEEVPASAMRVQLPDERWNDAWHRSSWQLSKGQGGYGALALEAARPIHAMDLVGLHETSGSRLDFWLKSRGAKANGDFVDGEGSLQHGEGESYEGIHPQTGWLLFALAERALLSGDKAWFVTNRPRMQAAADWIIRQRKLYLQDLPNREALESAGLQPPQGCGDQRPGRWRWYLFYDAFSLKGLRRFADALAEVDAPAAEKYQQEVRAYASDLLRAVEREIGWSPVRPARDGAFHRWIPSSLYSRGMMAYEFMPDYGIVDIEMGSLPLADIGGVLDPYDRRVAGHLDLVEDKLYPGPIGAGDDTWFFTRSKGILLKYSFVGNLHLLRDDVPCFLRHWMVHYAASVEPDGSFGEWGGGDRRKTWDSTGLRPLAGAGDRAGKDLMYTGWFMENFRNLLVMEIDDTLWLAKATPRHWLEQGKKISIKNAPTHFGAVAYEITSDVDNGKITATVEMPARIATRSVAGGPTRKAPKEVVLRFRHPTKGTMRGVTINGKDWKQFDADKETITLKGLIGQVAVTAQY
jgi:hypothetical protein